jgi:DNA-directed RNA polymerase specialized sigma24 family protein
LADQGDLEGFRTFVCEVEPRLRRALVAHYGPERGREATAEALLWAFEHQGVLTSLRYPAAYLYRVGQSKARLKREPLVLERPSYDEPIDAASPAVEWSRRPQAELGPGQIRARAHRTSSTRTRDPATR